MNRFRDPKWGMILIFLGIIFAVPLIQMIIEARQDNGIKAFDLFTQLPTAANLRAYEKNLEKGSWAGQLSRPWVQLAHFGWLKSGGEKAVLGIGGWFFYKPGLNYMLSRPPSPAPSQSTNDPVAAIVDFRDQLAARGIRLLVMPVPNKESIYPDRLTTTAKNLRGILTTRTQEVLEKLRAANGEVVDLFKELGEARQKTDSNI